VGRHAASTNTTTVSATGALPPATLAGQLIRQYGRRQIQRVGGRVVSAAAAAASDTTVIAFPQIAIIQQQHKICVYKNVF
jgi:hypothetical protein